MIPSALPASLPRSGRLARNMYHGPTEDTLNSPVVEVGRKSNARRWAGLRNGVGRSLLLYSSEVLQLTQHPRSTSASATYDSCPVSCVPLHVKNTSDFS